MQQQETTSRIINFLQAINVEINTPQDLNINKDYRKSWGEKEGLREIITNAIDASSDKAKCFREGDTLVIENPKALDLRHFILGKGKGGAIGQFHEGLKIFVMIALRNSLKVRIFFDHFEVEPAWAEKFGARVAGIKVQPHKRVSGTRIEIKTDLNLSDISICNTIEEIAENSTEDQILEKSGVLAAYSFVTKKRIQSLFGYSLNAPKDRINNEREFNEIPKELITRTLLNKSTQDQQERVLILAKNHHSPMLEVHPDRFIADYQTHSDKRQEWIDSFYRVFGEYACLLTEAENLAKLQSKPNVKPIALSNEWTYILTQFGVKTDLMILIEQRKTEIIKSPSKITRKNIRDCFLDIALGIKEITREGSRIPDFYTENYLRASLYSPILTCENSCKEWAKKWSDHTLSRGIVQKFFDNRGEEIDIAAFAKGNGSEPDKSLDSPCEIRIKEIYTNNYFSCLEVLIHELAHLFGYDQEDHGLKWHTITHTIWMGVMAIARPRKGASKERSTELITD